MRWLYLSLLVAIMVVATILASHKIETFAVFDPPLESDPSTPNDFLCYNYLKAKRPAWKIDEYQFPDEPRNKIIESIDDPGVQKILKAPDLDLTKMIHGMRTGLGYRHNLTSKYSEFADACVVPRESLSTFGISANCTIGKHRLESTGDKIEPSGCAVNLSSDEYNQNNEENFKDLLGEMHKSYYSDLNNRMDALISEVKKLADEKNQLERTLLEINNDIGFKESELKDKCDADLIQEIKRYYTLMLNAQYTAYVDDDTIKKFDKISCKADNLYQKTRKTFEEMRKQFIRFRNWKYWYDIWVLAIPNIYLPWMNKNIAYLENIFAEYSKYA